MQQDSSLTEPMTDDLDGDRLREYCGVFGVFDFPEAAAITALGLHALQHRGQEAAGIVSFDNGRFHGERRLGLVGGVVCMPRGLACGGRGFTFVHIGAARKAGHSRLHR